MKSFSNAMALAFFASYRGFNQLIMLGFAKLLQVLMVFEFFILSYYDCP